MALSDGTGPREPTAADLARLRRALRDRAHVARASAPRPTAKPAAVAASGPRLTERVRRLLFSG